MEEQILIQGKFPQRNRVVVSFASIGVLIIEAGQNSGSFVTAKIAKKLGKKVWAVPGPISSKVSIGCNDLIKSGDAKMATSISDIVKAKNTVHSTPLTAHDLNSNEAKIFKLLQLEPMEIDEIARKLGESVVEIGSTLSIMGIKGLVTESGGKYCLNQN